MWRMVRPQSNRTSTFFDQHSNREKQIRRPNLANRSEALFAVGVRRNPWEEVGICRLKLAVADSEQIAFPQ